MPLSRQRATLVKLPLSGSLWVDLDRVKIVPRTGKGAGLRESAIGRDGAVFAELKEWAILRGRQLHIVALRLFEKKTRQRENGIGDRAGFDLRDDAVEGRRDGEGSEQ